MPLAREGEVVLDLVDVLVEQVGLREALAAGGQPGVGRADLSGAGRAKRHILAGGLHQDERDVVGDVARVADDGNPGEEFVGERAPVPVAGELHPSGVGGVGNAVAAVGELITVAQGAGDGGAARDDGHGGRSDEHVLRRVDVVVRDLKLAVGDHAGVDLGEDVAVVGRQRVADVVDVVLGREDVGDLVHHGGVEAGAGDVGGRVHAADLEGISERLLPLLDVGRDEEVDLVLDDGPAHEGAELAGGEVEEGGIRGVDQPVVADEPGVLVGEPEASQILALVVAEDAAVEVVGAALGDGVHQAAGEVSLAHVEGRHLDHELLYRLEREWLGV